MNRVKPLICIIGLILLSTTATSLQSQSLEKSETELIIHDTSIEVNSTHINKELPWQKVLMPDKYRKNLNDFDQIEKNNLSDKYLEVQSNAQNNTGKRALKQSIGINITTDYGFQPRPQFNQSEQAIPDKLTGHRETGKVKLKTYKSKLKRFEADKFFEINQEQIDVEAYTHYNKLIINYTVYDNDQNIIDREQDIYRTETSELVPFQAESKEVETLGDGGKEITQDLVIDNLYGKKQYKEIVVMNSKQGKFEELLADNVKYERCQYQDKKEKFLQKDRKELLNSGIKDSIVPDSVSGYNYNCFNITVPKDSLVNISTVFTHGDLTVENGDEFKVKKTPEYYTFVIGSGGATRISGGYSLCSLSGYDTIIIEGSVYISCGTGSISADNLVEIQGTVYGEGNDGQDGDGDDAGENDGENGEDGKGFSVSADNVILGGGVDVHGGNGGDGVGDGDDDAGAGGNGGNGGSISIDASNELYIGDSLNAIGGKGGSGENECYVAGDSIFCDTKPGGDGGNAGSISITNSENIEIENSNMKLIGGAGGRGANGYEFSGDDGGNAGNGASISIESAQLNIEDSKILTYPEEAGSGGYPEYTSGGSPGTPGDITLKATNLDLLNNELNAKGGDADYAAGGADKKGTKGGKITVIGQEKNIKNNNFKVKGGRGEGTSEDACDDEFYRAEDGGNGGTIKHNLYDYEMTDNTLNAEGGEGGEAYGCNDNEGEGGDGGDGGLINTTYRDNLVEAFNNYNVDGGDAGGSPDDGEDGQVGALGTIDISQDSDLSINTEAADSDIEITDYKIYSQDKSMEYRIDARHDILAKVNFTSDHDLNKHPNITFYDRNDDTVIDNDKMTLVSQVLENNTYYYEYKYEKNMNDTLDEAGKWLTDVKIEDDFGNIYTDTQEFIFQVSDTNRGDAIQRQARFGENIGFDQLVTYKNPSSTSYQDHTIRFELFEGTNLDFFEVTRGDNNIDFELITVDGTNYLEWDTALSGDRTFEVQYDIKPIEVQESVNVETLEDNKEIATQTLTVSAPSPNITIQDVQASYGFHRPGATVDWQLVLKDTDVTFDEEVDPFATDEDGDGLKDTLNWDIDAIDPDNPPQQWKIITDLGKPISKERDNVITNKPVEEGKPIKWRAGFRYDNPNDFIVPYTDRLRVPLGASNIRLDGQLVDTNFDRNGRYVIFDQNLNPDRESTTFLKYQTRSISTTRNTNKPNKHVVDEPSTVEIELTVENLVDQTVSNISHPVQIPYGENLNLVDKQTEEVIDQQETVQQEYTVEVENISASQSREYSIGYDIPTAESEHVRDGVTDQGNKLIVKRITSNNNQPLENVWYETSEVDCVDVVEIRELGGNETDSPTSTIENYKCGDLRVPLNTLQPDEEIVVGIEYRKSDPEVQTETPVMEIVAGAGKWILVGILIIIGDVTRRRVL